MSEYFKRCFTCTLGVIAALLLIAIVAAIIFSIFYSATISPTRTGVKGAESLAL